MSEDPLVVCVGAATLDLIAGIETPLGEDDRQIATTAVLGAGGLAATASVALSRLGIPVAFIGTVGNDAAGGFILDGLKAEGVNVSGVRRVEGQSAMSPIWVHLPTAHRSIAAFYGTVGPPALRSVDLERCHRARWVHVDHVGFACVRQLRSARVTTPVSVDAGNPIPSLDLQEATLYAPTEAKLLERYPDRTIEDAIAAALRDGPRIVVVTRGDKGSVAGYRPGTVAGLLSERLVGARESKRTGDRVRYVEAPPVRSTIVSTLGAGDVFHGALLAGLIRGLDLASALLHANAAAALSCAALDGRSAIPRWNEVVSCVASLGRSAAQPDLTL